MRIYALMQGSRPGSVWGVPVAEREDKRMDDLVTQVNQGFARVDGEIKDLRGEIRVLRGEMKTEIHGLRSEMRTEIQGLRGEMKAEIQGLHGEIDGVRNELRAEMHQGFERIDRRFDRLHHWAVAVVVAMLGLIGSNVLQSLAG